MDYNVKDFEQTHSLPEKWLYEIETKEGQIALDNGLMEFDTEEKAREDAENSIDDELCKEYNITKDDFVIKCYKAIY